MPLRIPGRHVEMAVCFKLPPLGSAAMGEFADFC